MLICSAEAGEDLHHIVDLLLLLGASFIEAILLLKVEEFATDDELFATNAFSKLVVVDIDESELHLLLLLTIVVVKLHFRQQQLRIVVVLHLEVTPLWHVTHYLSWV